MPAGFLYRDLQQRLATILEELRRPLPYEDGTLVPTLVDLQAGMEELIREYFETVGNADIVSGDAHDFPTVEVGAGENAYPIYMVGSGFNMTLKQERNATARGTQFSDRKMRAAERAIAERLNLIAAYGDARVNATGLLNNAAVTTINSSETPFTMTGNQLFEFVMASVEAVHTGSNSTLAPNTINVSTELDYAMQRKFLADSATPVKTALSQNGITVIGTQEARSVNLTARGIGQANKDRMVIYVRDPEVVERHIEVTQMAPEDYVQVNGLRRSYPMFACTTPVIINWPGAFTYIDHAKKA